MMEQQMIADGELQFVPQIEAQYVYLDFDGEETVYRNKDLDLNFSVTVQDSGMTEEQKRYILAELSAKYASENIFFTVEKPEEIQEYSTIFIGQTDDFEEYGSFAGLAETIDKGNQIKNDDAFVFADYTCDTDLVISVIDHELGHIFEGMEHEYVSGDINDFAGSYHLYGPSLSLGTISCPATITGCVSGATFDTYHYTSYVSFSVAQSGYYTVLLRAQHASGGSTTVSGRVSGPPDIWDSITLGNSASFYFTAGETYSIQVSIPVFAATNSSSVYNYTVNLSLSSDSPAPEPTPTPSPTPVERPDLTVSSISLSDSSITTSESLTVSFCVKNNGSAASALSNAYIYCDNTYLGSCTVAGLSVGASATRSYTIPAGKLPAGTHTIRVIADGGNAVAESNENNNTDTKTITVSTVSKPDLVVSSFTVKDSGGDKVGAAHYPILEFTITNKGNVKSAASSAYIYNNGEYVTSVSVQELAAGGSASYSLTLYHIECEFTVVADGGNQISESNESNNTSQKVSFNGGGSAPIKDKFSDLAFYTPSGWGDKLVISTQTDTFSDSNTFTTDDNIYLDFTVINQGKIPTTSAVYVDIYVDGEKVDYCSSSWLYKEETCSWTDKNIGKLSAGKHTIEVQIREDDAEKITSNNTYSKTIVVAGKGYSDLAFYTPSGWDDKLVISTQTDTFSDSNTFTTNDYIYLDFAVQNQGTALTMATTYVDVYVDDEKVDYWLCSAGLDANATYSWTDKYIGNLSVGNHTIKVQIRENGAEEVNSNNTYSKTITVTPPEKKVDLCFDNTANRNNLFQFKPSTRFTDDVSPIYEMSNVYMQFSVANIGEEISSDCTITILVDGKVYKNYDCPPLGDEAMNETYVDDGYAYGKFLRIWDCDLGKLAAGTHTITVKIDSQESIQELDETNNVHTQTLTILPIPNIPNLAIVDAWIESTSAIDYDSLEYGADAIVKFKVVNTGKTTSGVSKTSFIWGVNCEEFTIDELAPGESQTYSFKLPYLYYGYNTFQLNVNSNGAIQEVTDYDNEFYFTCDYAKHDSSGVAIYPYEFVDLMVTDVFVATTNSKQSKYFDSDNLVLNFTIENIGSLKCQAVNADLFIDGKKVASREISGELDYLNNSVFLPTDDRAFYFDSDDFIPYEYQFSIGSLSAGKHIVSIVIDPDNQSKDTNIVNNRQDIVINIKDVTAPEDLPGNQNGVSFVNPGRERYFVEYSTDNFFHVLEIATFDEALDTWSMPGGTYQWQVCTNAKCYQGEEIISNNTVATAQKILSDADGNTDVFFANAFGYWGAGFAAEHQGFVNGWKGTGEEILLAGKNNISDVFTGSTDANVLVLTDDANGDALFVDDIYTAFGNDAARLSQIDEIRAGAGDDIIDLTSQKFAYSGNGVKIYGGAGNDTIWANSGNNTLFGDAGNDRLVGASGNDVIVGGSGNDSMHGGGGNDTFCFGANFGNDTVEQLSGGSVTLHFESGSEANWNADTLTYTDGANSVKVSGVTNADVTLFFGGTAPVEGAFLDAASEKIFEDKSKNLIA